MVLLLYSAKLDITSSTHLHSCLEISTHKYYVKTTSIVCKMIEEGVSRCLVNPK
jgi:hypothetical protein